MSPAPHRADKHVLIEEVVAEPDPIPENGALRKRARRVHRDHPDLLVLLAIALYQPSDNAALAHAGRSGEANRHGLTGVRVELGDHTLNLRILTLYLRD